MDIKYQLATSTWDKKELNAIKRVVKSSLFTMGKEVSLFEHQFAKKFKKKFAIMVNSGSSANLLMIAALFFRKEGLSLKQGDEVIVPSVSWSTTYMPLQQYGLKIKFVDIDINTLNFNLDQLASAITNKTKLIIAVNLLGNPNDFKRIFAILSQYDVLLIEDNCEAMGATYNKRFAGGFGLMGSFSTFFSHHISTMEGGMIVTDDKELYHILLSLRAHGWTRNLPIKNKVSKQKSRVAFEESFKFVLPGYNLRPLEISGAIGQEQLKKLDKFIKVRQDNAIIFKEIMKSYPSLIVQHEIGSSSWFGFSIIIRPESGIKREKLLRKLQGNRIEIRPIVAGNFTKNQVIKYFNYEIPFELRASEIVDKHGFFIGNHHFCLEPQLELLNKILKSIC